MFGSDIDKFYTQVSLDVNSLSMSIISLNVYKGYNV